MGEPELPQSLKVLRQADLEELLRDPKLVNAVRLNLEDGIAAYDRQLELANSNITSATNMKMYLSKLESMRQQIMALQKQELELSKEWQTVRAQMDIRLQPFSLVAVREQLYNQTRELRAKAADLEARILRPTKLSEEEAFVQAKQYVEASEALLRAEKIQQNF